MFIASHSCPLARASLGACAALSLALVGAGCEREVAPAGPSGPSLSALEGVPADGSVGSSRARGKVALCHRTGGGYVSLSVSANAVPAHMAHGDARVGDPAPGQPGLRLDASCVPVVSPRTITVSGFRANATWANSGPFTVPWAGPIHASAIVSSDYDLVQPLRLVLLEAAPGRNGCSLVEALPGGEPMSPPQLEAHWGNVPPGDYCIDVQGAGAPPFSWQANVTLP